MLSTGVFILFCFYMLIFAETFTVTSLALGQGYLCYSLMQTWKIYSYINSIYRVNVWFKQSQNKARTCQHFMGLLILCIHYSDIIMSTMASQITGVSILCITVYPGVRAQIKENIKAPHHWPLWGEYTGDHKGPVTQKMFPFDDIILNNCELCRELRCTKPVLVHTTTQMHTRTHRW